MRIDNFCADWIAQLDDRARMTNSIFLLLDGAFLPDLPALIKQWPHPVQDQQALFYGRPGATSATFAASAWLLPYPQSSDGAHHLLTACDGLPMVTAIESSEPLDEWLSRLRRWCTVSCDGMLFNFRYMDTRRLPGIARVLTPEQRVELLGDAGNQWRFIGRDGQWQTLMAEPRRRPQASVLAWQDPALDDRQFAAMLRDSEADEILGAFAMQNPEGLLDLVPSELHHWAESALALADQTAIAETNARMDLCEFVLKRAQTDQEIDTPAARLQRASRALRRQPDSSLAELLGRRHEQDRPS